MACYYLFMENEGEFYSKLENRDRDLIVKMSKCILSAYKHKKDKVDVFEVTFKDQSDLKFSIDKPEYLNLLNSFMSSLIEAEEYEICGEITKLGKPKRKYTKRT